MSPDDHNVCDSSCNQRLLLSVQEGTSSGGGTGSEDGFGVKYILRSVCQILQNYVMDSDQLSASMFNYSASI